MKANCHPIDGCEINVCRTITLCSEINFMEFQQRRCKSKSTHTKNVMRTRKKCVYHRVDVFVEMNKIETFFHAKKNMVPSHRIVSPLSCAHTFQREHSNKNENMINCWRKLCSFEIEDWRMKSEEPKSGGRFNGEHLRCGKWNACTEWNWKRMDGEGDTNTMSHVVDCDISCIRFRLRCQRAGITIIIIIIIYGVSCDWWQQCLDNSRSTETTHSVWRRNIIHASEQTAKNCR